MEVLWFCLGCAYACFGQWRYDQEIWYGFPHEFRFIMVFLWPIAYIALAIGHAWYALKLYRRRERVKQVKCDVCNGHGRCEGMMPEDGSEYCETCRGTGWVNDRTK